MIRSTFYGFTTALSGLKASQTSLDVIGQNVSNVNTEGYTRQRADQTSVSTATIYDRYSTNLGTLVGQGTSTHSLTQTRDTTLDTRFRTENPSLGRYDAERSAMSDISNLFDEATTEGVRDSILAFQTAFQNLSTNVGEAEFDLLAKSAASSMSKLLNQQAARLSNAYDQEAYTFENGSVADANSILKKIATLNNSIEKTEAAGSSALELYDQRNTLLDELSSYMDISYYYEKTSISPNTAVNTLHVSMKTASGQKLDLVDGKEFAQFGVEIDEGDDTSTISDNHVSLKLSGLTDDLTDDYEDIVSRMREQSKPEEPTDVTPVYGNSAVLDGNDVVIGYQGNYNPNALTNGIFAGTLNMLNCAGDYEVGGSSIRGFKYYANTLDTLASTMASQINTQNRSMRYTTDGQQIYNVSTLNHTTGEEGTVYYNGQEVAALYDEATDSMTYGYLTLAGDEKNYIFTEYSGTDVLNIQNMMQKNSNKMYLKNFDYASHYGGTAADQAAIAANSISNVKNADGKVVKTSKGETVYAMPGVDGGGNPITKYGTVTETVDPLAFEFTELSDGEQIYIEATSGYKKYTTEGQEIMSLTYTGTGDPVSYNGKDVYAIQTGVDASNQPVYAYGTIDDSDTEPFYTFQGLSSAIQTTLRTTTNVGTIIDTGALTTDELDGEYRFADNFTNSEADGFDVATYPDGTARQYGGKDLYIKNIDGKAVFGSLVDGDFQQWSDQNAVKASLDKVYQKLTYKTATGSETAITYQEEAVYANRNATTGTVEYGTVDDHGNFTAFTDTTTIDWVKQQMAAHSIPEKDGNEMIDDFAASTLDSGTLYNKIESWDENLLTTSDGVSTEGITAGNISVSDAWNKREVCVTATTAYSRPEDDNTLDNSNILKMIQLFNNDTSFQTGDSSEIPNGQDNIRIFSGGYEEFFSYIGQTVASDVSETTATADNFNSVVTSIDEDRSSVSGVSIDEEAVDIYQYQRAYEAASRVMTALDELLDRLINSTGKAGL